MAMIVLVPNESGERALASLSDVRPLRYQPGAPLPQGAHRARVLVPGFLSADGIENLLAQLPELELIQLLSAGAELWADQVRSSVRLSTARGAHGASTAEWAMAVLLQIYRDLEGFAESRRERRWDRHRTETLQGKRVLIVGAGDLGRDLARKLRAFDSEVTLVAHSAREGVRSTAELPRLLGEHDATVLMVPLTDATTGMVDAAFLAAMPDGAVLVNAARGPVVRTEDLLAELDRGRLRAALDVTDPEPLPAGHPLWSVPNLLLTPHVAGASTDAIPRVQVIVAGQLARYAAGEPLANVVGAQGY
ncbi:MAG: 2-hydroxyacid dehydrogenase [Sciscionella sp.]